MAKTQEGKSVIRDKKQMVYVSASHGALILCFSTFWEGVTGSGYGVHIALGIVNVQYLRKMVRFRFKNNRHYDIINADF